MFAIIFFIFNGFVGRNEKKIRKIEKMKGNCTPLDVKVIKKVEEYMVSTY